MSDILITGAAGFIGFHLTNSLSADYSLCLIDDFRDTNHAAQMRAGKLQNVKQINILSSFIDQQKHKPKILIHLAAETGIADSLINPKPYFENNVNGTFNVLEQCGKNDVKYLIYASSSSVYSKNQKVTTESSDTSQQLSFYGSTKKISELMVENYCKQFGITAICLRFFTVYGSWTRPDMAAYKFMSAISKNEAINLYNNGAVYRDFTHVSDVVAVIKKLIPAIQLLKAGTHEIFNVGMGNPVSVKEYATLIANNLDQKLMINDKKLPSNELELTHSDPSKLLNFINYKPKCSLTQGVQEMTDWFKSERYDQ